MTSGYEEEIRTTLYEKMKEVEINEKKVVMKGGGEENSGCLIGYAEPGEDQLANGLFVGRAIVG